VDNGVVPPALSDEGDGAASTRRVNTKPVRLDVPRTVEGENRHRAHLLSERKSGRLNLHLSD